MAYEYLGRELQPATRTLLESGAKATVSVTLNAFGTWADGQTIVLPTIGSHTIRMTTTGDIDLRTLAEADAKAALVVFLNSHASASCSVSISGDTLTVTALAYGTALNGSVISGTILAAPGTMTNGATAEASTTNAYNLSVPIASLATAYAAGWRPPTVIANSTFTGTSVAINGLVSSRRYRITVTIPAETAAATTLTVQPDGSDANCYIAGISGSYATPLASASLVAGITKANAAGVFEIAIGARTGGLSSFQASCGDSTSMANVTIRCGGATTTDYTSLTLTLNVSRTNVAYKVIEETV